MPEYDEELAEKLAAVEHEQWMEWAKSIMEEEEISPDRRERWEGYMVPYAELSEEDKESDREYARKVLDVLGEEPDEAVTE